MKDKCSIPLNTITVYCIRYDSINRNLLCMRTLSVLLILISCLSPSYSQHLNPDDFNAQVPQRFDLSRYNAADLFDSCEIKDRKIKSAALLQVYDNSCFTDTLFVYYFDSTGKAIMQVSFTPPDTNTEG